MHTLKKMFIKSRIASGFLIGRVPLLVSLLHDHATSNLRFGHVKVNYRGGASALMCDAYLEKNVY